MNDYHFSAELAKRYGLDEAIMLHHFAYWVQKNTIDGRNIHDGRAWSYSTQDALAEWFPFWSRRQIQRILKSLEEQSAVIKGQFNGNRMNRTMWYSVVDSVLDYYDIRKPDCMESDEELDETVQCIAPNRAMHSTEACGAEHETVPCNISNKERNSRERDSTHSAGAGVSQRDQFDQFWAAYPRKEGKKKAWEKWQKLDPDPALFAAILSGLDAHIRSEQWRRGVIPHPTTWLNGERWEDELTPPLSPDRGRVEEGGCEYV